MSKLRHHQGEAFFLKAGCQWSMILLPHGKITWQHLLVSAFISKFHWFHLLPSLAFSVSLSVFIPFIKNSSKRIKTYPEWEGSHLNWSSLLKRSYLQWVHTHRNGLDLRTCFSGIPTALNQHIEILNLSTSECDLIGNRTVAGVIS